MLAVGESRGGGGWQHGSVTLERSRSASPPSDFDRRHCRGRPEDRGADRSCPAPGPGRPRFEATVGGGYHGDQLGWRRADRLLGLRTSSGLVVATGSSSVVSSRRVPGTKPWPCLLYTSPSPRDRTRSRMPSS